MEPLRTPNVSPSTDPRLLAAALQQIHARSGPGSAGLRYDNEMRRREDEIKRLDKPLIAHNGVTAALVGVLNGINKYRARMGHEAKLEDIFGAMNTEHQRKAQEAMRAKRAARDDAREDFVYRERWKRNNPVPMSPQDQLKMDKMQVDIANVMQEIHQGNQAEERKQVQFEQEQQESQDREQRVSAEKERALNLVTSLLSPQRQTDMERATGTLDGATYSLRQGTVDWENDFQALGDLLTMDNLGRMSGVLSESDIKLIRDSASGGLNLRSSTPEVRKKLEVIRSALSGESTKETETPKTVNWSDL